MLQSVIFGISAGGASVHMHMLSPLSEGLFHKAISQSGVAISPLIITNLRNNAVIMAEELGIQSENWTEMLTTLQEISTENILNAELSLNNNGYPHTSLPIVEIMSNDSTFLAREPMDIIRSGDFKQVPYMNGFVSLEGVVIFIDRIDDGVSPLIPDLSKYIPTDLRIEPGSEAEQDIVQRFKDFYYDGRESSRENITADINFFGDYSFNFPQYRTTREQLEMASNPIYLYYFAVDIDDGLNIPGIYNIYAYMLKSKFSLELSIMMLELIVHLLILTCALIKAGNTQELEIPQGTLRGATRTNRDGGTFYAFKSIPYAKPPVGELRFKAPEPAEGWEGVRNATQEIPQCVQILSNPGQGQEDCLYINVYTPEIPDDGTVLKPVMVSIYGGAFMSGDAKEAGSGPQFFMTKDVIVVTFNYRIGIFGFLSLDDPSLDVTGNAGLKDQVLALQWVKHNIEYFGGDPNNVLIFGGSAGGMSVHLQLLSPVSQGLYHKAISQSGVSITPLFGTSVRNNAIILAEQLEIQIENWSEMLTTLQEISSDSLVNAETTLNSNGYPYLSSPIVEIASNHATFLEREPMDIIRSGDFSKVPYLHGFTDADGLLILMQVNDDYVSPLIPDLTIYIPKELRIEPGSEAEKDIVQRFKDFYYDGRESTRENITSDVNFFTDYAFGFPHYRTAVEQLKTTWNPIYLYYFTAVTELNDFGFEVPGAVHGSESVYLWDYGNTIEEGSLAESISRNLIDLWTNFAIYGNPTPEGFSYVWEPVQENQINYLHIGNEGFFPEVNVRKDNMQLWSDIYEEYYQN